MKTITFDENTEAGRTLMSMIRNMKPSVRKALYITDSKLEAGDRIPSFAYTHEERITEIVEAEAEDATQAISHEDFLKETATW